MITIPVNNPGMACTDEGRGKPVVFIHGFPLNRNAWAKQVDHLSSRWRVIAPDLRGFGGTGGADGGLVPMERYADEVAGVLNEFKTGPVVLAGHSMGGYIALAFARKYPQQLAGLVLVATRAGADSPEGAAGRRATVEKIRTDGPLVVVDAMAPKMVGAENHDPGLIAEIRGVMGTPDPAGLTGALLGMAERPDATPWLGAITAPALVITGDADALIPDAESRTLAAAIPGATLSIIPGAGHLVAFEQPVAFNAALTAWLEGIGWT